LAYCGLPQPDGVGVVVVVVVVVPLDDVVIVVVVVVLVVVDGVVVVVGVVVVIDVVPGSQMEKLKKSQGRSNHSPPFDGILK